MTRQDCLIILAVVLIVMTGMWIFIYTPPTAREIIVQHYSVIERPVEVVKEVPVETIKEVPVYLDRPVEKIVYPEWKIFDSIDDVPKVTIVNRLPNNCLPMAQEIQIFYLKQGYITSIAVAYGHRYDSIYVTDTEEPHAGLLIETKQGWYFVDPNDWQITKLW